MTLAVSIKLKGDKAIKKDLKRIRKSVVPKLETRAINKAASRANTETKREVAKKLGIKVGLIGRRIKVKKGKGLSGRARLIALMLPIRASDVGKPRQTKAGAKAGKFFFAKHFVAQTRGGSVGIFTRKGRSRLPIKATTIPIDPPFKTVADKHVFKTAAIEFKKEFERLARVALKRK